MKKLFSTNVSDTALSLALFILRVGTGLGIMVNHGLDKLQHFSQRAADFKTNFLGIGPTASYSLVVFAEFFCAGFIVLGLFTRLAAIPLVINMAVALFMANKGNFFGQGESAGIYLLCFLVILIAGPGKASLDRLIAK